MLTGIVLASGLSSRMGENKLLIDYKGKPLFQHSFESIKNSNLDEIIVVTCYDPITAYCKANDIKVICNPSPELGQGGSIKLGVLNTVQCSDLMFFVADQPNLKTSTINEIIDFYENNIGYIIIPKHKNTPANPKVFPNSLRNRFLEMAEDVRGVEIIAEHKDLVKIVHIDDYHSFVDIDTPEDYKKLTQ